MSCRRDFLNHGRSSGIFLPPVTSARKGSTRKRLEHSASLSQEPNPIISLSHSDPTDLKDRHPLSLPPLTMDDPGFVEPPISNMPSNRTELAALLLLISEATKVVENEFQRSEQSDIPSLNELNPHPLDTKVYSVEMRNALQILEGACAQLCATVARPSHTMLNVRCVSSSHGD